MSADEPHELEEPSDYPQQEREWRGGWLSVVLPLAIIAVVAALILGWFWLSTS
jgi:hypothetical protein